MNAPRPHQFEIALPPGGAAIDERLAKTRAHAAALAALKAEADGDTAGAAAATQRFLDASRALAPLRTKGEK